MQIGRWATVLVSLAMTAACGSGSSTPPGPTRGVASAGPSPSLSVQQVGYGQRVASYPGRILRDPRITESSGLAQSRRFPGVTYTHNDRGDTARVFAIGDGGVTRAVLQLPGVNAQDWEDISAGPDQTVWVGDIGDNSRSRTEVQVYRFREPTTLGSGDVAWTRVRLTYPDGPHDAEALLVNPKTGTLYVVTKQAANAGVYRATSLSTDAVNRLERVTGAPAYVTAGEFHPDGRKLALRSYEQGYVYSSLGGSPRVLDLTENPPGESLTWTQDGRSLVIGSEGVSSRLVRLAI